MKTVKLETDENAESIDVASVYIKNGLNHVYSVLISNTSLRETCDLTHSKIATSRELRFVSTYVTFKSKLYKQTKEIRMDSPIPPAKANLSCILLNPAH